MPLTDIPLPLFVPVGAVLAACITGAISFVSLVTSKEQKISEFRQAWIDAFRSELADFSSQARRVSLEHIPVNIKAFTASLLDQLEIADREAEKPDPFHENRQRMAQAYYALRLRLNPEEADHKQLLTHLDNVYEILNSRSDRYGKCVTELDNLARVAQVVLKREWVRVKYGEGSYRATVRAAKWIALILAVVLVALLGKSLVVPEQHPKPAVQGTPREKAAQHP
jgi:hypothetical protein